METRPRFAIAQIFCPRADASEKTVQSKELWPLAGPALQVMFREGTLKPVTTASGAPGTPASAAPATASATTTTTRALTFSSYVSGSASLDFRHGRPRRAAHPSRRFGRLR